MEKQPGGNPVNISRRPRLRPRWHKVISDLWGNRVRTLLVIASVAVGLFAIGMIATIHDILSKDMRAGYALMDPANVVIHTGDLDDDMVDTVRGVDGVAEAEGQRVLDLMVRTGPDEWSRIAVEAIPDFDQHHINRVTLEQGSWPPDDRQIVIERNKLNEIYMPQPGVVEIKLPSGKIRRMSMVGVVHDLTLGAGGPGGFFLAPIQGYITTGTLEWLDQADTYNQLLVTVREQHPGQSEDETYLREVANRVSKTIENNGGLVYNAQVRGSLDHPNAAYVDAMAAVLFVLGLLVVFLSSFLITNTLTALLNQQSPQIAIMKTIGARSFQVIGMYVALIFIFGLLALAISLPLSREAAFRLTAFLSERINFDVLSYRTVASAVILQVAIAVIVPQAAGIMPILRGARMKVQDALSGSMTESDPLRRGWFDRSIHSRSGLARKLSRPLLISLRNTFRHKGRLALTLVTLTLGGAVFIATFNVRASMENYIERVGHYFMADVNLTMDDAYRMSEIENVLSTVPGVGRAEGWAYGNSELLLANDKAGDAVNLMGPPVDSSLIEPILLKGRWVRPGDRNAIVLSERFLSRYPHLKVGDTLRLRVNGDKTDWVVVGFFQLVGKSAGFVAYTDYEYLSQLVGETNKAVTYRVIADHPNLTEAEQTELGAKIEKVLQDRGFGVIEVSAGRSLVENTARPLNTLTTFLLIMALLTAIVGSIGLMGTMSMNVMDRTREIGVMRAIGASDRAVMNMVIVEGMLIGLISWLLGTLLAAPISKLLSDVIHLAVFDARAEFTFTITGPLYWLALVVVLSVLASVIPARSAARLTIQEALAYE